MMWHRVGRLALLVIVLAVVGASLRPQPAAADDGYPISNGSFPNQYPAVAISPDNTRVCAVWGTFATNPDAYVRLYTVATATWSPPLSVAAVNVSQNPTEETTAPRCAIDAVGNVHVVWTEGGATKRIQHRYLPAGSDPAVITNWSAITTVSTEIDPRWVDVAAQFNDAAGRIWIAYAASDGVSYRIYARTWAAGAWSPAAELLPSASGNVPRIAVDNLDYVHVIHWQAGAGIQYLYRTPAGVWTPGGQLPGSNNALEQTGLTVNRVSGDVHAVYTVGDVDARIVYYVKKTGPVGPFTTPAVPLTGADNHVVPRIAWSPGRLIMVSDVQAGTDSVLVYNVSVNEGVSWGGATPLTDALVSAVWPWVTADAAGNAYIVYWNNRTENSICFVLLGASAQGSCAGTALQTTPTPSPTATRTVTVTPTATRTPTPSPTGTRTPTPSPTAPRTVTPSPTVMRTPSPSPTLTRTATATVLASPTPTASPTGATLAAQALTATTPAGVPVVIPVPGTSASGDVTVTATTQGANGTVVITAGGTSLTYTPRAGFVGTDGFNYTITNRQGRTATARVTVTVAPPAAAQPISQPSAPPRSGDGSGAADGRWLVPALSAALLVTLLGAYRWRTRRAASGHQRRAN